MRDGIIVAVGLFGLSAALLLGSCGKRTPVCDSGESTAVCLDAGRVFRGRDNLRARSTVFLSVATGKRHRSELLKAAAHPGCQDSQVTVRGRSRSVGRCSQPRRSRS